MLIISKRGCGSFNFPVITFKCTANTIEQCKIISKSKWHYADRRKTLSNGRLPIEYGGKLRIAYSAEYFYLRLPNFMMRKSTALLILLAAFGLISALSCNKESRWDCIKLNGKRATELRALPAFTKIYINDNIDVYITQGNTQEVKIEAGDNLIPLIKTVVDSGVLNLSNDNHCNWARSYKKGIINIYITMPVLRYIWHFGSGLLKSTDTIYCDTLDIWAHQTGDAEMTVNANLVYANMHTTADLTLHGKSGLLGCYHTGEGYLHCEDFDVDYYWTHAKTSGNEYLHVNTGLSARIDWEGNIYYTGNAVTEVTGEGKGKLIKQD